MIKLAAVLHSIPQVFVDFGAPSTSSNLNLYRRLLLDLANDPTPFPYKVWASMRDVMASVRGGMATQSAQIEAEFDRYTTIAHYYALKLAAGEVRGWC